MIKFLKRICLKNLDLEFFKKNYKEFTNYGRDMDNLFTKSKRSHSKRIFNNPLAIKKLLTNEDIESAYKMFLINKY